MTTNWKVADALEELRRQLNALAPHRSVASDGGIGNAEHASRDSDHNPWWVFLGIPRVTARDFTHDPAGGLDCQWLADALERGRDPRVKYVIWRKRIMSGAGGPSPWVWRPYSGANTHEHHLHLSVVPDARALSVIPWLLSTPTPARPAPQEDDDMTPEERERLARVETGVQLILQQLVGPGATIADPFPGPARGGGWESWRYGDAGRTRLTLVDYLRTQDRELSSPFNVQDAPSDWRQPTTPVGHLLAVRALMLQVDALVAGLSKGATP